MSVHLNRSDPTIDRIIRAAYPGYTGKKVRADLESTVRFYGTQWDEGSRRQYRLVRLADMACQSVDTAPYFSQDRFYEVDHAIPAGFVVVVLVLVLDTFRGNDSVEIISPPENVSALLPAPMELTDDEKTVLIATRCRKSSYAGVKDYRFSEANRYRGITKERWDTAKASLIERKLLNKAGALTVEGRNAAGTGDLYVYSA